MALPKSYETVARLGATSTTGDTEGEITVTGLMPPDPPSLPTGELLQRPPAYSAVKVDGKRAYERARAGEEVVLDERPVTVYRFEQLWREDDRAAFAIECSAGTYVRTLISDLGDAYCTRAAAHGDRAVLDRRRATRPRLIPLAEALSFMPSRAARRRRRAARGARASRSARRGPEGARRRGAARRRRRADRRGRAERRRR